MATTDARDRHHDQVRTLAPHARTRRLHRDPSYQAYAVLRGAFVVAPVVFGLDKFTNLLVRWDQYLAPVLSRPLPVSPHQAMYAVGVVEVLAGLLVLLHPRLGSVVVAAWLGGIVVNLLLVPGWYDVALRDFGLLLAAVALQRLSTKFDARPALWPLRTGVERRPPRDETAGRDRTVTSTTGTTA
ncbi:hypothetical protein [Phycicoccus sp. Soil748]|uniref:hypothetical protein n=1 Tax=Intrasporangiaceae TaxID=85021 RepID=UPI000A771FA7|nr:hypothetical protein [Phycicoccus sp. Soil748]